MSGVEAIERAWREQPAPPRGRGRVDLLVLRADDRHLTPERAAFDVDAGVVGDKWSPAEDPEHLSQVTLMMSAVVRSFPGEHPLHLPGDNVMVDLDIGEEALPAGTKLRIGEAILEVTAEPHAGCKIFRERFGVDALRWVNHKDNRHLRLRGVKCRVLEGGEVAVGDVIQMI